MANSLNLNLEGQIVVLRSARKSSRNLRYRVVRVLGGFGALAQTNGESLVVLYMETGTSQVLTGYDVLRLATAADLAAVTPESLARWRDFDPYAPVTRKRK